MESSTAPSITSSYEGPAKFHGTVARFKRTISARGAVAAPKTSSTETTDETSSEESLYEPVLEDISAATRLYVANNDIATVGRRHDSILDPTPEQAATSSILGTLTPRPPRKDLRASLRALQGPRQQPDAPCTRADDMASENEGNGESIVIMRKRLYDDLERLDDKKRQLDQIAANMDAQDATAAWEAQARVAREQREAAAGRLAQRIVAEVVPMSASGRAYGDVAEIRRCAAPKVEYQTIPDGNYSRFRHS